MRILAFAALLAVGVPWTAVAQNAPGVPDPATVTVPDLSGSAAPEVVANGWKYFFFQREGVGFAEAHADLADCFRFLAPNDWGTVKLGRFVPWESRTGVKASYNPNPYGLVGALMLAMVEGTLVRRDYQAKMRRCMETRGYTRYGVSEEVWENVTNLPKDQSIAVQAKIASGPSFGGKVPEK
ncbi:MAG: hypothetical protein EOP60_12585 [Sphingomonadales bacterium]|nr:MAG: hypothetical protein EOP60_12585 [Sphingomonadales bacterium]